MQSIWLGEALKRNLLNIDLVIKVKVGVPTGWQTGRAETELVHGDDPETIAAARVEAADIGCQEFFITFYDRLGRSQV